MNRPFPLLAVIVLTVPFACATETLPGEDAVVTNFAVLVGFPAPGVSPKDGVFLVPGALVQLGQEGSTATRVDIDRTLSFAKAVEKLWATFRLDPGRQIEKGKVAAASVGKPVDLPEVQEAGIKVSATLQSLDSAAAVYRVVIRQGDRTIGDSNARVTRGGRAVVGGVDGEQAPYIFVVLEPEDPADSAKSIARLSKSKGMTAPVAVNKVAPVYPEGAKKDKVTGAVVVQVIIGADGSVQDLKALEYPDPRLSKAAIDAIRQWTFQPARLDNGTPVSATCDITINFQLR